MLPPRKYSLPPPVCLHCVYARALAPTAGHVQLTQTEINLGSVVSTATATASAETAVNGVTRAATSTELLVQNPKINLGD